MASHDAIPHEIIPPGTALYRCDVRPGEVVVIHAMGRFRAARVIRVGPKRAYLIHPAANPDHLPHKPARARTEVYALVGTEPAGVVKAGARGRDGHTLAPIIGPSEDRAPELLALGEAVRHERNRRGLSLEALASAARVQMSQLQALEAGQLDADLELLLALAQALGIRVSAFVIGAEARGNLGAQR
jgi:DNA-binding XRE family transcriptional regulator